MKNNEELLKNNERQNIDEVKPAEQILISRLSKEKKYLDKELNKEIPSMISKFEKYFDGSVFVGQLQIQRTPDGEILISSLVCVV